MLLARLMDEFPLPEQPEEAEQLELFTDSTNHLSINEKADPSL
jgi:hypothetical protein